MENKSEISNKPICQCKYSIIFRIIDIIVNSNSPILIENLVDIVHEIVRKDNSNIIIDDLFLKTYIRSLISELIDKKLIKVQAFEKSTNFDNKLYFVQISEEIFSKQDVFIPQKDNLISENKQNNQVIKIQPFQQEIPELQEKKIISSEENKLNKEEYRNKLIDEIILKRKKIENIKKDTMLKKLHEEVHKYNEIKDIGQELLGYISNTKGQRVKDLYDDLGISDDDK